VSFAGVEGESLIGALAGIAVSSGSACTSSTLEPSYVLKALGVDESMAHTSIRFSFGRFTTEEQIHLIGKRVISGVNHLRMMSPLWDMIQEGVDLSTVIWSENHH
jgi:cysteine desulfurase